MEKNVSISTYATLDSEAIRSVEEQAKKLAQEAGYEDKDEMLFEDLTWEAEEVYFDREEKALHVSGEVYWNGKKLGYFSPLIPLGNDTIIEIIEHYMKKMGKLKTVMEALKD